MKSIDFPQANIPLAKDQPEYKTLFVFFDKDKKPQFPMTMCFQLSEEEIQEIVKTGKLWFTQVTFGKGFSPVMMSTKRPFPEDEEGLQPPMDENRTTAEVWDKTHFVDVFASSKPHEPGPCINCGNYWEQHYWSSRQCKL